MKSMRVVNIMPRPRSQVQTLGRGKYGHTVKMYYMYMYMIFIVKNLFSPLFPYTLNKHMAMKPYTLYL